MVAREFDIGVFGRNLADHFIPEGHGVDDAVGLGRRGDFARACAGHIEGVARDPLDANPSEDRLLNGHFVGAATEHPSSDLGVLTLWVLADDDDVKSIPSGRQGTVNSIKEADGPQRYVLVKAASNGDEQSPQ